MPLHDWELTNNRAAALDLMPDTCDVYRRSAGSDAYGGGGSYADAPAHEGVQVQVEPMSGTPTSTLGASFHDVSNTNFELAFPYGTDIRAGDKIVVTSLNDMEIVIRLVEEPESWDVLVSAQGALAQ